MSNEISKPFGRIVWTVIFCLFWIDNSIQFDSKIINILILIIIPIIFWKLWGYLWIKFNPNEFQIIKFELVLFCLASFMCLVNAIILSFADSHIGNDQYIQTRDGYEAVGNDIIIDGPDTFQIFSLVIFTVIIFIAGINNYKERNKRLKDWK